MNLLTVIRKSRNVYIFPITSKKLHICIFCFPVFFLEQLEPRLNFFCTHTLTLIRGRYTEARVSACLHQHIHARTCTHNTLTSDTALAAQYIFNSPDFESESQSYLVCLHLSKTMNQLKIWRLSHMKNHSQVLKQVWERQKKWNFLLKNTGKCSWKRTSCLL